jgi:hypothetical protein
VRHLGALARSAEPAEEGALGQSEGARPVLPFYGGHRLGLIGPARDMDDALGHLLDERCRKRTECRNIVLQEQLVGCKGATLASEITGRRII